MVAFEALFLEDARELRYRLSLRVAVALQKAGPTRVQIFDDMRLAYDLRSRIVHGAPDKQIRKLLKNAGYRRSEFLDRIDDYLRESIWLYISHPSQGHNRKQFIRDLDVKILGD